MGGENTPQETCGLEAEYDPADDAMKSYYVAIADKKARGDTHYPEPISSPIRKEVTIGVARYA